MIEELDTDTLLAFTEGQANGLKAVYKLYYQQIFYYTYKLLSNKEDSEDITSETFLRVFKMRKRFSSLPQIKKYLYITARNSCIDHIRKVKRQKTFGKDFSDVKVGEYSNDIEDVTMLHAILDAVVLKQVYEAVQGLPGKCQQIFKLLYIDGLKPDEIAHQLSITPETVRSQKRHALELLRVRLSDNQMALALIFTLSLIEYSPYLKQMEPTA